MPSEIERARLERERAERERVARDGAERHSFFEQDRIERERSEKVRLERERASRERVEPPIVERARPPRDAGDPAGSTTSPWEEERARREIAAARRAAEPAITPRAPGNRTDVVPRGAVVPIDAPAPASIPTHTAPRRVRPPLRRVRRTVVRVDPLSVLKISLFFYAIFVVLWLVLVAILYQFANGLGLFDAIEGFGEVVVGYEDVDITLGVVERWAFLVGVILAVLGSLLNLFLAFLYNVAADLIGGVNVTFVERDV